MITNTMSIYEKEGYKITCQFGSFVAIEYKGSEIAVYQNIYDEMTGNTQLAEIMENEGLEEVINYIENNLYFE